MTTAQYRERLKALYKSKNWYKKVDDMSDEQIVAIYLRQKLKGKV